MLNQITDSILPEIQEWQNRPLNDAIPPLVWMDAIHYKVREEGQVVSKAVYTVLGINLNGRKELLGIYISESEGARFWLQVLSDFIN